MKIGMVGLGRMGSDMVRRLLGAGRGLNILRHARASPAPVLSAALTQRFSSRGDDDFAKKVLSALRYQFGGQEEKHP